MQSDLVPFRRLLLAATLALAAWAALPALASATVFEATPTSVTFAPELVGKQSSAQPVSVLNMTPGTEGIENVSVVGTDFVKLADTCSNATVEEGAGCFVSIAFAPQATGTRLGQLELASPGGGLLVVPLEGRGFTKRVTVPATSTFPVTTVGTTTTQQVALKNESEAGLTISDIKLEGADPSDFKLENSCNGPLPEGATCQLSVGFVPGATGERTAQLKVVSDGLPGEDFIALSGEGVAPDLSFEPSGYDFGLVEVHSGNQSSLTVRNTGPASVQLGNVEISGPDTNEFFIPGNNCSGSSLIPGQTCQVQVQFNANNEGSFNAGVRIGAGGTNFEAPLSGRAERPQIEPSAFPLTFSPTGSGSSQLQALRLTNTGNLPVSFFIAIISGGDVTSFQLIEEHCTGRLIAAGESCAALVRFRPQGAGTKQATMSFFGGGEGALQVPIEGVGTASALTLSPESRDFGAVAAGATGPTQLFQLRNEGDGPYAVDSVGLAGADLGEFAIRSDSCSEAVLAPGESCAVAVRFAPESTGAMAATLRLRDEGGTIVARLSGDATAAATAVIPMAAPAPAPAAAKRLVVTLRARPAIGADKRLLIGRARCDSSQACVVSLGGKATGRLTTASNRQPATRPLGPSRITIAAGRTVPLSLVVPAELRDGPGAKKIAVKLRWRTGGESGRAMRTFALPR